MKVLEKYKKSYGKSLHEEMLWDIALRKKETGDLWKICKNDEKRYWRADPFLTEVDGNVYLFYEKYDKKKGKGEIAVSKILKDFSLVEEKCIISKPYHLSFPNIFEYKNHFYMIPETKGNNTIELYIADLFPYDWHLYKVIMSGINAVDTIILEKNEDAILLHTSVANEDACNVENWIIVLDEDFNVLDFKKITKSSEYGNRNGGKIQIKSKKMYRVGQDCSDGEYGKGLVIYKINNITNYEEEEIAYWGLEMFHLDETKYSGVHTYNTINSIEAIDLRYTHKRTFIEKLIFLIKIGGNYVKRRLSY